MVSNNYHEGNNNTLQVTKISKNYLQAAVIKVLKFPSPLTLQQSLYGTIQHN